MNYIFHLDVASLLFIIIVAWRFSSQRQFPSRANRTFKLLLFFCQSVLLFDILGCLCVNYASMVSKSVSMIINSVYYIIEIGFPATLIFYVFALLYPDVRFSLKTRVLAIMPACIMEILTIVSIPMGWIFSIDAQGILIYGPLSKLTYFSGIVYLIIGCSFEYKYRDYLERDVKSAFSVSICILMLSLVLQNLFPRVMLSGTAFAASFLIMFFVIQNPASMVDSVTGMLNRKAFILIAKDMYAEQGDMRVAVINIRGLSRVNSLYGIEEGDKLLRSITMFLADQKKIWVCRLAAAQFVMISSDTYAYQRFVDRVSRKVDSVWPINSGKESVHMQLSVCYIRHAEILETPEMLLDVIALSAQRREQTPDSEYILEVNEKLRDELKRGAIIEDALRTHMEDQEGFSVNYQSIYDVQDECFVGAEALLSFSCPELGTVPTSEFLPVAERCGFFYQIDNMVVRKVFSDIRTGIFDDLRYRRIHINLSAASFATEGMLSSFLDLAREYEIDPGFVVFEITEEIASLSYDDYKTCMDELESQGFSFALDDFGMGYSNFARLIQMPFGFIKIDRSMLNNDDASFREIVSVLKNFGSKVIAEGVETEEQLEFVKNCGIRFVQGWYYAKAMPAEKLKELQPSR